MARASRPGARDFDFNLRTEGGGRGMAKKFRYVKSCGAGYLKQGLIWFQAQNYKDLPKREQRRIREACQRAGGDHAEAIFTYVTTDAPWQEVCEQYFLSEATLQRIRRKFYREMGGKA